MDDDATTGKPITWDDTIRHFFTNQDVTCMARQSGGAIELNNHASVKKNAEAILGQVSAGNMPPAHSGEQPWSPARVKQFEQWIAEGCR